MSRIICYHQHPSLDGMTTGWIIKRRFPETELVWVGHNQKFPDIVPDALVVLADFTFNSFGFMRNLIEESREVLHFDHVETMQRIVSQMRSEYVSSRYKAYFSKNVASCAMAWDAFFDPETMPYMVQRVQDHELDLGRYEDTPAYIEGLRGKNRTFKQWEQCQSAHQQDQLVEDGKPLIERRRKRCRRQIDSTGLLSYIELPTFTMAKTLFSNARYISDLTEQCRITLGENKTPVAVSWHRRSDREVLFCLATEPDSQLNAGNICKRFGGGGNSRVGGWKMTFDQVASNDCGPEVITDQLAELSRP